MVMMTVSTVLAGDPSHGVVQSTPVGDQAPEIWHPDIDGPAMIMNDTPSSQISTMKMPKGHGGMTVWPGESTLLLHEVRTGVTEEISAGPASGLSGASGPGYDGVWADRSPRGDADSLKTFGDMALQADTSLVPWLRIAKLKIRFVNEYGLPVWGDCSGTMIDAETVLTAGHCVYAHTIETDDGTTHVINDWAEEIWVYPGWDGNSFAVGDEPGQTVENFGFGYASSYMATNPWVWSEDHNYDLGAIRIERAVGMVTGWYGWQWGQDCSWIDDRPYFNASFPAEECDPDTGLHNGRDMYFWGGWIDSCSDGDNQLVLDTSGGCFNAGWGGMSGSSLYYYVEGGVQRALAVASTADRDTWLKYCKLSEAFVSVLTDGFIPVSRGNSFDLQALNLTRTAGVVTAGEPVSGLNFLATNPTNGVASGAWSYGVYLSGNENISNTDTFLLQSAFTQSFSSMESVTVMVPDVTIPISTPTSIKWLGTVLDPATDTAPNNNATHGWDAHQITVWGVADIVAGPVDAPGGAYCVGDSLEVSFQVTNQGGDQSNPITVEVRISSNEYISIVDPLVGTFSFDGLPGQGTFDATRTVTLPTNISARDWYVGILVYSDNDVEETNDRAYDPLPITVNCLFKDGFESGNTSAW